jgi:preprotein translocase subunit SecB
MLSPLQLKGHRFTSIEVQSHPTAVVDGKVEVTPRFSAVPVPESPGEWHVTLRVDFGPANEKTPSPYEGCVEIVGIFSVDPSWPEEKSEDLVRVNGTSMLYGSIRETILFFTSRSLHGEFLLPTLSFLQSHTNQPKPEIKFQ